MKFTFRKFNLISSFVASGKFHIFLPISVMIYFQIKIKSDICDRMARALSHAAFIRGRRVNQILRQ